VFNWSIAIETNTNLIPILYKIKTNNPWSFASVSKNGFFIIKTVSNKEVKYFAFYCFNITSSILA